MNAASGLFRCSIADRGGPRGMRPPAPSAGDVPMKLFERLARRDRRIGQNRRKTDLAFDLFEDRLLLTQYTVNSAADANTGVGDAGTLRYVLNRLSVNGTTTNRIDFAIPTSDPGYDAA